MTDKCIWYPDHSLGQGYVTCGPWINFSADEESAAFKYCPFCGKELEVTVVHPMWEKACEMPIDPPEVNL